MTPTTPTTQAAPTTPMTPSLSMTPVTYHRPLSITDAAALLAKHHGSRLLAGGTDFLVKWRNGLWPDLLHIIDLNGLNLRQITVHGEQICIGSSCTMAQLAADPIIQQFCPALAQAAATVGAPQIRNAATIGGNIGNASPAGDSIPALYSLDAEVVLRAPHGMRRLPVDQLMVGPGRTKLDLGEIIENVVIPKRATQGAFLKLGERRAHAISKVNIAVSLWEQDGVRQARIALGSVAPTVIRVPEAERLLAAAAWPPAVEVCHAVAECVAATVKPIDDIRSLSSYRRKMAGVLTRRAIALSFGLPIEEVIKEVTPSQEMPHA